MADAIQISRSIESKLHEAWRQERRFFNVRGASRFLVWLIALIAISFVIDWGFLSRNGNGNHLGLVLLVVNVGILGWVLWNEWLRYMKPFDPLLVALDVEEKHPELASVLVSYTQLKGKVHDQPNVSPELVAAMREQAIEKTRPLDFREIVDFGQLKRILIVAACVLVFFAALSIRWGEHFATLFQRLAGVNAAYPTETQIDHVTGNITVRIGDPATVNALPGGVIPETGEIYTKLAGSESDFRPLPMKRGADSPEFSRELKELTTDLLYYVRLGDSKSGTFRIRVVASPRVTDSEVALSFPGYMGRADETTDQLNIEVPEGTELRWELACNPAVKDFEVFVDGEMVATKIDATGTKLTFPDPESDSDLIKEIVANESFKYTFRWTERESGESFEYDDVQYNVRVVDDTVPEVELRRPTSSGLATLEKTVTLEGRAGDDHGLDQAWLVYSIDGSAEERIAIKDFGGVPNDSFAYKWNLAESIKDLKEETQLTFAVEVADRHPESDTRKRRTAERRLTIVHPDKYLEWYRAEVAAQQEDIKRSRESEQASSDKVKQIKNQEGETDEKDAE